MQLPAGLRVLKRKGHLSHGSHPILTVDIEASAEAEEVEKWIENGQVQVQAEWDHKRQCRPVAFQAAVQGLAAASRSMSSGRSATPGRGDDDGGVAAAGQGFGDGRGLGRGFGRGEGRGEGRGGPRTARGGQDAGAGSGGVRGG